MDDLDRLEFDSRLAALEHFVGLLLTERCLTARSPRSSAQQLQANAAASAISMIGGIEGRTDLSVAQKQHLVRAAGEFLEALGSITGMVRENVTVYMAPSK